MLVASWMWMWMWVPGCVGVWESSHSLWSSTDSLTTFRVRATAQMESIREEQRLKASVIGMRPVEYGKECRLLLDAIKMYETKA